ncbi:MAG: helix-turn-helix domain-containing protein [Betaproteobacteria bacterium]|nr:helix-turn-helix domain-containing protein [Betaproteobacteria bacterium]
MDYLIKTPAQLGDVMRGQRKSQRLTQQAVGDTVDLPQKAVSLIETNPGPASLERVFRVLSALGLEVVVRQSDVVDPARPSADW